MPFPIKDGFSIVSIAPMHRHSAKVLPVESPQKIVHLLIPPWPVVVDIVAPVVDPGINSLVIENSVQGTGIFDGLFLPGTLAHGDDDRTAHDSDPRTRDP